MHDPDTNPLALNNLPLESLSLNQRKVQQCSLANFSAGVMILCG